MAGQFDFARGRVHLAQRLRQGRQAQPVRAGRDSLYILKHRFHVAEIVPRIEEES